MERILQRVRGVMNLLLIWALVLFWVATVRPVNIHQLCSQLNGNFGDLERAAQFGGTLPELSLAKPQGPPLSVDQAQLLQRLKSECGCLYSLKYDSLASFGNRTVTLPATVYTQACRRALETAQAGAAANHPGLTSELAGGLITKIERLLAELEWQIERLELGPTATLMEVANEARPRIAIPGSGQSIPMAAGVALSITGLACVYLYLVSLLRALREAMREYDSAMSGEWLFLHPGLLGPTLGLLWLLMPFAALFSAGRVVFGVQSIDSVSSSAEYTIFVLLIALPWSVVAAFRARWKQNRLAREATASETVHEQRAHALADTGIALDTYRRVA